MHKRGTFPPAAVHKAAVVFKTPGPGTTENAPGFPVAFEYP